MAQQPRRDRIAVGPACSATVPERLLTGKAPVVRAGGALADATANAEAARLGTVPERPLLGKAPVTRVGGALADATMDSDATALQAQPPELRGGCMTAVRLIFTPRPFQRTPSSGSVPQ